MENRKGTHLIKIKAPLKNQMDWDLLGYTIGRLLPTHAIPVMEGFSQRPDVVKLKSCYASMATTSGAEMCHWVGVTPEGRTREQAFGGKKPVDIIEINQKDFEDSYNFLNTAENTTPNYISLGCPHYAIDELAFIADYLDGKKIHKNVRLNVWTSPTIKDAASRNGYTQRIEASGAILLTSSCPLTSGKMPADTKVAAFDSAKQAHYVAPLSSAKILYSSMTDCLNAAVTGKWEGKLCQQ
jgi:predicted aconitase